MLQINKESPQLTGSSSVRSCWLSADEPPLNLSAAGDSCESSKALLLMLLIEFLVLLLLLLLLLLGRVVDDEVVEQEEERRVLSKSDSEEELLLLDGVNSEELRSEPVSWNALPTSH
jgi:Tfp pilus assembly protein PilN